MISVCFNFDLIRLRQHVLSTQCWFLNFEFKPSIILQTLYNQFQINSESFRDTQRKTVDIDFQLEPGQKFVTFEASNPNP